MNESIWLTDNVMRAKAEAAQAIAATIRDRFSTFVKACGPRLSKSESPIEAIFWTWWQAFDLCGMVIRRNIPILVPQHEIESHGKQYRLDFALLDERIAIEVDGHEFHERTLEQVNYRNQRDTDLQTDGWIVFHFSGSQIVRDASACVLKVIDCAETRSGGQCAQDAAHNEAGVSTRGTT